MAGRTVALIGAGALAARKRALLAATPAHLREFEQVPDPSALASADFVIVAFEEIALARAGALCARAAGRPVNVVDHPELSDFHIPAIIDRGGITIGVASGGVAPTLARDVRAAIEASVPVSTGLVYALARRLRADVRAAMPDVSQRRGLWERLLRGPPGACARTGDLDAAEVLARQMMADLAAPAGLVWLVGAGPGDPELLTLKALRCLQDGDLIVYDRLVDPRILDMARRDAERLCVGKARAEHSVAQQDIHEILINAARGGKRVVRLKGGDPFIFGRGGEELAALQAAGIAVHVVPGITAALGCAASVGAALTHRDYADAVTFISATGRDGGLPLDDRALADPRQTLVIYMGSFALEAVRAQLLKAGLAADTPVLIIENGTRPDQRVLRCALADLAQQGAAPRLQGPTLIVVGEAARAIDSARVQGLAALAEAKRAAA